MSATPSLAVYIFCVFEVIWWLISFGFLGIFPDLTCHLVKGTKCNTAEHFVLLLDMMNMLYFVIPFVVLTVMNTKDQRKLMGLAATAFYVTVAQVVGYFFSFSDSFLEGVVNSGMHLTAVIVHLVILAILYTALTMDGDGPQASPYFSDLWFKPKLFLVIITILFVIFLVQNSDFGDYSAQLDVTKDMITPFFVILWGWWSLISLVNVIFYSFVISYGDANEQAVVTGIAVAVAVAGLIVTPFHIFILPKSMEVSWIVVSIVLIVVGLATLWKHYSDRKHYSPVQTSDVV